MAGRDGGWFLPVAGSIPDSEYSAPDGRRRAEAILSRLDSSWAATSSTTLGVMLASVATSRDKEAATRCMGLLLSMRSRLSAAYRSTMGWKAEPPGQDEVMSAAAECDAAATALAGSSSGIGMAVLMGLVAALPWRWTGHLKEMVAAGAGISRLASPSAARAASSEIADRQGEADEELDRAARRSVMSLNSTRMRRAEEWAGAAGGVFDACVAGGFHPGAALAEAVRKVGFPGGR